MGIVLSPLDVFEMVGIASVLGLVIGFMFGCLCSRS